MRERVDVSTVAGEQIAAAESAMLLRHIWSAQTSHSLEYPGADVHSALATFCLLWCSDDQDDYINCKEGMLRPRQSKRNHPTTALAAC